jgi:hypothetical protein
MPRAVALLPGYHVTPTVWRDGLPMSSADEPHGLHFAANESDLYEPDLICAGISYCRMVDRAGNSPGRNGMDGVVATEAGIAAAEGLCVGF